MRCSNCGNTTIATLDPQDNGSLYCESCDRVTWPTKEPRPLIDYEPRKRRDVDE